MSHTCEQLRKEYLRLTQLKDEFALAYRDILEKGTPDHATLVKVRKLKETLEAKHDQLQEKLWPFEGLTLKEAKAQYDLEVTAYRQANLLTTLESGQEGITDSRGNEYPLMAWKEVMANLRGNHDPVAEKLATMEAPRVHLTPFALSPEVLAEAYANAIEAKFKEARVEGSRRIPDPAATKLRGADGTLLELRADRQNVYLADSVKEANLSYFPKWKQEGSQVKPQGGMSKQEAITQIGGWSLIITEGTPLVPEQGQGKTITKEIRLGGKAKKEIVTRKQVEGGLNTAQQYQALTSLNEQGLTPEDYLSYTLIHLQETDIVLDDDRGTLYYTRLLGAATADGGGPGGYFDRDLRRAYVGWGDPEDSDPDAAVRGAARIQSTP